MSLEGRTYLYRFQVGNGPHRSRVQQISGISELFDSQPSQLYTNRSIRDGASIGDAIAIKYRIDN